MRLSILAFLLGVGLLQMQAALPGAGVYCALALLALLALAGVPWRARRACWRCRAATWLGCAALGFVWAGVLAQQRLAEALPEAWEGREITLSGVVASLPQRFERGQRFTFDVEAASPDAAGVPRHILLAWYHAGDEADADESADDAQSVGNQAGDPGGGVRPGQRWRFTVRLRRPHGNANPHAFDYEAWLLERAIRATGSVRGPGQRLDDFVARPAYAVERWRDAIRGRFLAAMPEAPYLGVLIALAVGDQRAIPHGPRH